MAKKSIRDFEGMIGKGEMGQKGAFPPADGFQAQTVVGTARATGTGWNISPQWDSPELPPDPTRPAGRSNRTGE